MWLPSRALPTGWLWCDGTPYSPEDHPDLYLVLGDDHTPDLRPEPWIIYTGHGQEPAEEPEDPYEVGYREGTASASEDAKTWKAEALREAADALSDDGSPIYLEDTPTWLRERAEQIEDGTL